MSRGQRSVSWGSTTPVALDEQWDVVCPVGLSRAGRIDHVRAIVRGERQDPSGMPHRIPFAFGLLLDGRGEMELKLDAPGSAQASDD